MVKIFFSRVLSLFCFAEISHGSKSSSSAVFLVIVALGGLFSVLLWTMYAYRNPHSTSGQILIRVGHDEYVDKKWKSTHKKGIKLTSVLF